MCSLSGFGSLLVLGAWVPQVRTLLWLPAFVPPSCAPVSESSCWILLDKQKNFKAKNKRKMLSKNNMGRWGYVFSLKNSSAEFIHPHCWVQFTFLLWTITVVCLFKWSLLPSVANICVCPWWEALILLPGSANPLVILDIKPIGVTWVLQPLHRQTPSQMMKETRKANGNTKTLHKHCPIRWGPSTALWLPLRNKPCVPTYTVTFESKHSV